MDIIKTTKLTKYYGKARGIIDLDTRAVTHGEFFGSHRPKRCRKVHDNPENRTLLRADCSYLRQCNDIWERCHERKGIHFAEYRRPSIGSIVLPRNESERHTKAVCRTSRKKDCTAEAKLLCERLQLDTARKVDDLSFGNRKRKRRRHYQRFFLRTSTGITGAGRTDRRDWIR